MMLAVAAAAAALLSVPQNSPPASNAADLAAAIGAYDALDWQKARLLFDAFLSAAPPAALAARAHLYEGLLAFNSLNPQAASVEFEKALMLDPSLEMPPDAPAKVWLAFERVRDSKPARAALTADGLPAFSTAGTFQKSHALSLSLGAGAAVAALVACVGWDEALNFESLRSSSSFANPVPLAHALSAQSSARVGQAIGIVGISLAVGLTLGAALTW